MDKEPIIKELQEAKNLIEDIKPQLNSFDAIITLLSLYEIADNELNSIGRKIEENDSYNDPLSVLLLLESFNMKRIIEDAINVILENPNNRQELEIIPPIESITVLKSKEYSQEVLEWRDRHYNPKTDAVFTLDGNLAGSIPIVKRIVLQKFHQIKHNEQIYLTMKFLEFFGRKIGLETLLNSGIPAELTEDRKFVKKIEMTPIELLENSEIHPRTFSSGPGSFPLYKSNVEKISRDTLKTTILHANAPIQKQHHDNEHNVYYEEFFKIPRFPELFHKKYGISLQAFRDGTLALKQLTTKRDTAVIKLPKKRLIIKLRKICKCSNKDLEKLIDLLTVRPGEKITEKSILFDGINYIFSWSTVALRRRDFVAELYDEYIDANIRGIEFEKECRKVCGNNKCIVFDDRIQIPKQILSDEVSMNLWKRIKKRTDIDVIAIRHNSMFVIECKSELPHEYRKNTQKNKMEKYFVELQFKGKWIADNFIEFKQLIPSNKTEILESVNRIVPILVTGFINPFNENHLSVTIKELDEILKRIVENITEDITEVDLGAHTTVTISTYNRK